MHEPEKVLIEVSVAKGDGSKQAFVMIELSEEEFRSATPVTLARDMAAVFPALKYQIGM